MTDKLAMRGFLLCGLCMLVLYGVTVMLGSYGAEVLLAEDGPVESLSAAGYFVCAGLILGRCDWTFIRQRHAYLLVILLLGCRELDFHKKLTTTGIFKSRFFLHPEISGMEKSLGLLVILLLVYLAISIVRLDLWRYLTRFRVTSAVSVGVLAALVILATAKLLDGLPRKVGFLGLNVNDTASFHLHAMEEILELGIPIIMILTASVALRRQLAIADASCEAAESTRTESRLVA